jgi:hypothetical protein
MNTNYKKIKGFASACKAKKLDAKKLVEKWAKMKLTEDEIAYMMLKIFYSAINGDWVADFDNHDQPKYFAWWWRKPGVGFVLDCVNFNFDYTFVSARLCCETREQQEHAAKYGLKMWRKFLDNK